jgi:hypothetical protein
MSMSERETDSEMKVLTLFLDREESVGQNGTPHDEIPMKITRSIRGMTYEDVRRKIKTEALAVTCDTVSKYFRQRAGQ